LTFARLKADVHPTTMQAVGLGAPEGAKDKQLLAVRACCHRRANNGAGAKKAMQVSRGAAQKVRTVPFQVCKDNVDV
jgi:hypothetical protein